MRIFLAIITLTLCLPKASFAEYPYSYASKGVTAHLLHLLLGSMVAQYAWPEGDDCEGSETPNEDDPPPPSPSPALVAPLGDANNPFWLIPPTKSPSPSPKPSASPTSPSASDAETESESEGEAESFAQNLVLKNIFTRMLLKADTYQSRALAQYLMQEFQQTEHPQLLGAIIDRINSMPQEARQAALSAINEVTYPDTDPQESESLLSFADIVAMQLSEMNNGLTPEVQNRLLVLARSETALIEERVAAAALLYLRDEGNVKNEAKMILNHLVSMKNLPLAEELAQYVLKVLSDHNRFAEELASELSAVLEVASVLTELRTAMSSGGAVNLYAERPSCSGSSALTNPRKRKVDQVSECSNSNKEQRVIEGDVSVGGNNLVLAQEEQRILSAGRKKGTDDEKKGNNLSYVDVSTCVKVTPVEQAERLGRIQGAKAAQNRTTLKSEEALKRQYKNEHRDASAYAASAYAMSYTKSHAKAYGRLKVTPVEHAERLGRINGASAAREGSTLTREAALKNWYKEQYPDEGEDAAREYAMSYVTYYLAHSKKR